MVRPKKSQTFEELSPAQLSAFKRTEWFETAKLIIQIVLMAVISLALIAFLILVIVAGVLPVCSANGWCLPDTAGVKALSTLFIDIAGNAKAVALFALGFFFKDYLNAVGGIKK